MLLTRKNLNDICATLPGSPLAHRPARASLMKMSHRIIAFCDSVHQTLNKALRDALAQREKL